MGMGESGWRADPDPRLANAIQSIMSTQLTLNLDLPRALNGCRTIIIGRPAITVRASDTDDIRASDKSESTTPPDGLIILLQPELLLKNRVRAQLASCLLGSRATELFQGPIKCVSIWAAVPRLAENLVCAGSLSRQKVEDSATSNRDERLSFVQR